MGIISVGGIGFDKRGLTLFPGAKGRGGVGLKVGVRVGSVFGLGDGAAPAYPICPGWRFGDGPSILLQPSKAPDVMSNAATIRSFSIISKFNGNN